MEVPGTGLWRGRGVWHCVGHRLSSYGTYSLLICFRLTPSPVFFPLLLTDYLQLSYCFYLSFLMFLSSLIVLSLLGWRGGVNTPNVVLSRPRWMLSVNTAQWAFTNHSDLRHWYSAACDSWGNVHFQKLYKQFY